MRCVIVLDQETTGLESDCEIISIGAIAVNWEDGVELDGGRFERHIVPTGSIPGEATAVNGFTKENGLLYKNGELVEEAVRPQEGLKSFAEFLSNPAFRYRGRVYLLAHGAFRFDGPILYSHLKLLRLDSCKARFNFNCIYKVKFKLT